MVIIKRVLPILLAVMVVFGMAPVLPGMADTVHAADVIGYINENGDVSTIEDYYTVDDLADAEGISMYDGNAPGYVSYYVVKENKTFENRLNAFGEVHLILCDGATLTLKKGLNVPEGSSLHIYAQSTGDSKGKIFAATSNVYSDHAGINIKYAAAIGGNDGNPGGTIVINGGDITAHGYNYGAGIGSGDEAGNAGNIVINGGKVNAYGGYDAAGIGGGNETKGGEIVINGGDVHAESGYYGAAIGGGDDAGGGHIVINDGKVYARNKGHDDGITASKVAGAAIGGGRHGNAGKIEIKGGEVTACSMQRGAGIGSGGDNNSDSQKYSSESDGGEIYISGGTITADSNYNRTSTMRLFEDGGAGIGSGAESFGVRIEITGGHITAYGSCYAAEDPDQMHPTGIKPSAVIGNGYDTQSTGYVKIAGDENSKTYIHAAAASQNAIGQEPGGMKCTVEFDYPRAIVEKDGSVLNADDRFTMITNDPQHAYKIYLCDHGRTFYETDPDGHWMTCKQCGLEIEKQEHSFTYVQEEYGHSRWCEECGYVIAPVAHEFDPKTGECVCGHKGVKVNVDPKNAVYSGDEIVSWLERGETFTLPNPEDIGLMPPEMSEFKYWKVNGNWEEFNPGQELTIQADTEIYPVYEVSWNRFKAAIESADNGATIVLPGNCTAPADATHIVIPAGKSLTLDLNGYELARGNCNVTVTDGLGDGDVITVKGSLTVKDSSSDQTGRLRGGGNIRLEGDSVIDESIGGGGVTVAGGSFLLESGTLSGNLSNKGGAVGVCGGGTFTMTGGKIEDNMSWGAGSAVYVENGVFKAQGGEITDNQILTDGGAVEFATNGSIEVSGSLKITGNRGADADAGAFIPGNVYLADGQVIEVTGALTDTAKIGVSTEIKAIGTPLTTGLNGNGTVANFVSDSSEVALEEAAGTGEITLVSAASGGSLNDITVEIRPGGNVSFSAKKAAEGDIVSIKAIPDEGYRFDGWTVKQGTATIDDPDAAETTLTMGAGDVTVLASFVKDTVPTGVSINVLAEDGTKTPLADGSTIELSMGDELQLSASVMPEAAEEAPIVWSDDADGSIVSVSGDGLLTAKYAGLTEVTVTAGKSGSGPGAGTASASVWVSVAAKYTVTFDADGGEGADGEVYVGPDGHLARPNDPVKDGYRFAGWRKVEADGSLADEDYDFSAKVEDSFTLKAVWEHTKHDETTLEKHDFRASTCTEEGQAEYWHCLVCGKDFIFVDDTEIEEVTEDYIVIPAGHTYGNWEPLDEEQHQKVCGRDASHVEKEAHTWNKGEVTTQPTEEQDGVRTYTCEVCGAQKTEPVSIEDITEHKVDTYLECVDGAGEVTAEPVSGLKGTKVNLTAFPAPGVVFGGWKITGADCEDPTALNTVVTIGTSDIEAEALFILPVDDSELVLENASVPYSGKAQLPQIGTVGGYTLKAGTDCTLIIKDENGDTVTAPADAGTYTVTVEGNGTTCTGTSASAAFEITPAELSSASLVTSSLNYSGKPLTVIPIVKAEVDGEEKALTMDTDFTAEITDSDGTVIESPVRIGTYSITLTGAGNYTGTKTLSFEVVAKDRWINEDGYWYYYDADGKMLKNAWKKDSKDWCYLGSDGRMVTNGWAKDSKGWCWLGADGYWVKDKWIKDKGEWYYIKPNHYMAANEWAKDSKGWMYMASNGTITKSKWVKYNGDWYYLMTNGYMATDTVIIGDNKYVFDSSGKWIE